MLCKLLKVWPAFRIMLPAVSHYSVDLQWTVVGLGHSPTLGQEIQEVFRWQTRIGGASEGHDFPQYNTKCPPDKYTVLQG